MDGTKCDHENCNVHDFLPFKCDKCDGSFCLSHRSWSEHSCRGLLEETNRNNKDITENESGNIWTQSYQTIVGSIFGRHDGTDSSKPKEHFPIASSKLPLDETTEKAEVKMSRLDSISKSSSSTKERNISIKTKQMLMKSKAIGNENICIDDRFYINIHFITTDKKIPMYFSKTSIVGEVLEYIAKQATLLAFGCPSRPVNLSLCFQHSTKSWSEWDRKLRLDESVVDCDDVEVIIISTGEVMKQQAEYDVSRQAKTDTSKESASAAEPLAESSNGAQAADVSPLARFTLDPNIVYKKGDAVTYVSSAGETASAVVMGVHLDDVPTYYTIKVEETGRERQTDASRLMPRTAATSGAAQSTAYAAASETELGVEGGMTINVMCGTVTQTVPGLLPSHTVLDLKKGIVRYTTFLSSSGSSSSGGVTGLRTPQKLIFKGTVLKDKQTLAQAKLFSGCKVLLIVAQPR